MPAHRNSTSTCLKLLAFAAAALTAAGQEATPVFRSTSKLVQLNVVVEKKGHAVADLKKEDFEVYDNGKRQDLAVFVAEDGNTKTEAHLPPDTFTNQVSVTKGARSGYAAILLDWVNTRRADQAFARQQVIRLLSAIPPDSKVAILALGSRLRIVHDFTADTASLVRRIGALRGDGSGLDNTGSDDTGTIDLFAETDFEQTDAEQQFRLTNRVLYTTRAFEELSRYLAGIPGRKSLIWVSPGFPLSAGSPQATVRTYTAGGRPISMSQPGNFSSFRPELDRALRKLNDADVAVYPIDARGLAPSRGFINTLLEVAERTGGRAYYNRNDLDVSMRSALDDLRVSYTLGFYAAPDESNDTLHRLKVKVRQGGVTVRSRQEYHQDRPNSVKDTRSEIFSALASPLDQTSFPVSVEALRSGAKLNLRLVLDTSSLSLTQTPGHWKGKVEWLARFTAANSDQCGAIWAETVGVDFDKEQYAAAARAGFHLDHELEIPPDAATVRALVRDDATGRMGTLTIPLRSVRENAGLGRK